MTDVIVVVGAGSIGQAIARRVSAGKKVLLADLRRENAEAAAKILSDAGFADEVGTLGALLMGPDGAFITGSDFLMDGGVTATFWFGDQAE
ncbi:MAG: hypothetical protein QOH04_3213 [Sphingomonadales bacterium]|jgi:predicted dinucleotide-binding enzyme|nr:hypothetical protein [Sphingomonadales bacterium]